MNSAGSSDETNGVCVLWESNSFFCFVFKIFVYFLKFLRFIRIPRAQAGYNSTDHNKKLYC